MSLLEKSPHEGVYNLRLVLLQPVTSASDDVETKVVPDVDATRLGHFLLQKSVVLTPQKQHWRSDMFLAQGKEAEERAKVGKKTELKLETFYHQKGHLSHFRWTHIYYFGSFILFELEKARSDTRDRSDQSKLQNQILKNTTVVCRLS